MCDGSITRDDLEGTIMGRPGDEEDGRRLVVILSRRHKREKRGERGDVDKTFCWTWNGVKREYLPLLLTIPLLIHLSVGLLWAEGGGGALALVSMRRARDTGR